MMRPVNSSPRHSGSFHSPTRSSDRLFGNLARPHSQCWLSAQRRDFRSLPEGLHSPHRTWLTLNVSCRDYVQLYHSTTHLSRMDPCAHNTRAATLVYSFRAGLCISYRSVCSSSQCSLTVSWKALQKQEIPCRQCMIWHELRGVVELTSK